MSDLINRQDAIQCLGQSKTLSQAMKCEVSDD